MEKLRNETYQLKVYISETNQMRLVVRNKILKGQLSNKIDENSTLKEKVATENKSEKYLKNRFKFMVKKIMKTQNKRK